MTLKADESLNRSFHHNIVCIKKKYNGSVEKELDVQDVQVGQISRYREVRAVP